MRLPPPSSQSPTARASTRARGRVGNALKSKVASVLPTGNCALFRWRRMRRMSRSASSYSASTARKRAGPTFGIGPAFSENQAAISAQSLWKLGSRSAVSMLGSVWMQVSRAVTRMPPAAHRSWPGRGGVTATSVSSAVTFGASRDASAAGFWLRTFGFGLRASACVEAFGSGLRRGLPTANVPAPLRRPVHKGFCGDEEQIDHPAAGVPSWQIALQYLPRFGVFGAGEQAVAVDRTP
jgi:hypothetical protein